MIFEIIGYCAIILIGIEVLINIIICMYNKIVLKEETYYCLKRHTGLYVVKTLHLIPCLNLHFNTRSLEINLGFLIFEFYIYYIIEEDN